MEILESRIEQREDDKKIKIEEVKSDNRENFWTSYWTNSPQPYPPAMPAIPRQDYQPSEIKK